MTDDLLMAIRKLEGIRTNNPNYSFMYLFSNENIRGFTRKLSFNDNKILTVCSSGDQTFNLILNGALEIDLFDINIFTKYYFYLKKAAICGLTYEEFLDFFFVKRFSNRVFDFDSYLNIRNFIDNDDSKYFWDYLFCHYPGMDIYKSGLFNNVNIDKNKIIQSNDYLLNETNYNKLKQLLKNMHFTFHNIDIFKDNIPSGIYYDFIYLSNIFDYLDIDNKLEYTNRIKEIIFNIKKNMSDDGMIAVSYLFQGYDDWWLDKTSGKLKSRDVREQYFDNNYEYINFPGIFFLKDNQLKNKDVLMLYKKK